MIRLSISIEGSALRTQVISLERIRIGRDPSNDLVLSDPFISSRHGELRCESGAWSYRDLASTNGSALRRGQKVVAIDERCGRRVTLRDGDELVLGDGERPVVLGLELAASSLTMPFLAAPQASILLGTAEELDATRFERVAEMSESLDREALLALHRLAVRLSGDLAAPFLAGAFVAGVLDAFRGASHASVHLLEAGGGDVTCVASRTRSGDAAPRPLSRTVRDAVLARGQAVVFNECDDDFSGAESLHDADIRAGMCAPLFDGRRMLGFVQLDRRGTAGSSFARRDLELLVVFAQQLALALSNAALHGDLQRGCEDAMRGLARVLEAKDKYTAGHSEAVAELGARVARFMRLEHAEVEQVRRAALLHDVGKIGVPDAVLNKADRLSAEEFRVLKTHVEIGARILEPFSFLVDLVPIIRHHHERWDGQGYPSALKAEEIPMGARLLSVVDAYHSLVHDRVYRQGIRPALAIDELRRCAGTQFDARIVEALAEVVGEEPRTMALAPEVIEALGK